MQRAEALHDDEQNALACSDLRHESSRGSGRKLRINNSGIGFRSSLCKEARVVSAAHSDVGQQSRCL